MSEKQFLEDLVNLLDSSDWGFLPSPSLNLEMQTLAFRITGRMATMVHELLVAPTFLCPLSLWQVLLEPEKAKDLQALPPCMIDDFTKSFLAKYPNEAVLGQEATAVLEVMAMEAYTDIVTIEWSHGRVSRLVKQQVQTHTPSLSYVNGQLVSQRLVLRRATQRGAAVARRRVKADKKRAGNSACRQSSSKEGTRRRRRCLPSLCQCQEQRPEATARLGGLGCRLQTCQGRAHGRVPGESPSWAGGDSAVQGHPATCIWRSHSTTGSEKADSVGPDSGATRIAAVCSPCYAACELGGWLQCGLEQRLGTWLAAGEGSSSSQGTSCSSKEERRS